jgi:transposase
MGAQKTMKEYQLVINHFNNGKSLREIAVIIQRNQFTPQHIVERYKKANWLTSKVRKSAKKFLQHVQKMDFETLKIIQLLSATKLAAEIENH